MRLIPAIGLPAPGERRRTYSRPKPRAATSFAHDRLARRQAMLSFCAAAVVAVLYGIFALATEDSGLRRDTEKAIRDSIAVAAVSLPVAIEADDVRLVRRVVAAVSRTDGVAWARVEIARGGGTVEIVEEGLPDAPAIAELEARVSPEAVIVVGVDRDRIDERLRRGLVRQLVTSFVISLAGVAVVFAGFQSSVTRHVERIADALEHEANSTGLRYEKILLERAGGGADRAPDTLDRLADASNALLASRSRSLRSLQSSADALEARVEERTAAAEAERIRLRDMVLSSSDLMFETDREGRLVNFASNATVDKLQKWLGGRLSGLELCADAEPRERAALTELLAAFARLAPVRNFELRVRGPEGLPMWIAVKATPVVAAASSDPIGLRGCITDITDLTEARERAIRGERMSELGQLVAGVAHEINTPAGSALTFATSIAEEVREAMRRSEDGTATLSAEAAADIVEAADGCERNLRRVHSLVSSFKQVSADQASEEARRFDLGEYLGEVSVTLAAEWHKRAGRRLDIDAPEGLVMTSYPGAISQIVTNLVMNGLLHGFAGRPRGQGRMVMSASPDAERTGWVRLVYSDDGSGIEPETLRHIFEPFFTTRRGSGGTGLGLTIVHSLVVDTLGGEIEAHSLPGRGLTLSMRLPMRAPGVEMPDEAGDEG